MANATARPWKLVSHSGEDVLIGAFEIRGMFGDRAGVYPIFQTSRGAIDGAVVYLHPEDARLIVQAVNSFDSMKAALEEIARVHRCTDDQFRAHAQSIARTALKLAQKEAAE